MTDSGEPSAEVVPAGTEPSREAADLVGSAVAVVVAGIALTGTGFVGSYALIAGIALVQVVLLLAWTFGTRQPGRIGGLALGAVAAGAADALAVLFPQRQLGDLLPVVGLSMVALFVHQLTRGAGRIRVVESLSDTAVLVVSVVALAALEELYHAFAGSVAGGVLSGVVGAAVLSLASGYLVDVFLPVPRFDPAVRRGLLGVLLGGAVGVLIGYARVHGTATVEFAGGRGEFLGGAVGFVVALLGVGFSFVTACPVLPDPDRPLPAAERAARLRAIVTGCVPLALIVPIAYMLALAIRA